MKSILNILMILQTVKFVNQNSLGKGTHKNENVLDKVMVSRLFTIIDPTSRSF